MPVALLPACRLGRPVSSCSWVTLIRDVAKMYSWMDVAKRTTIVYDNVAERARPSLLQRFRNLSELGPVASPLAVCFVAFQYLMLSLLRWWRPAEEIEVAPDFPTGRRVKYEPLPVGAAFMRTLAERRRYVMNG